ncbi:hypothetical protein [Sphingomonas sp.]|jgi:hypothetical protein|uniref:hypothetical protein n=1 Tax=Sphingomonas sp. TaxID=28214 RepID=UPI002E2EA491|nr:hypothetical protein [Sphingomonas sp.]HEX4695295.1 hypothetical protein [Sphingomonas sp.]
MSDLDPLPANAAAQRDSARRLTMATAAGIALATFLIGLLIAAWAINRFRAAPTPAQPQPALVAEPVPTKVIVTPPASTDPASLSARQEMLSAQLAQLETRTAAVTGTAANAYGNASRAEALLVAFAARRVIDRGVDLGYLEQQLRDRFGTVQPVAVATIVQAAHRPVTIEDLRLGLDQIGPQLALGPSDSSGWGGAFWRMLGSLVVVHPKNTPSPVPGERLARVRRMLAQSQVEAAVEEVSRMPGASQANAWIDGARRYVAVRKALDTLEAVALEGRAATPPAPGTVPIR